MTKRKKVSLTPEQQINPPIEIVKLDPAFSEMRERLSFLKNLKTNPFIIEAINKLKESVENKPKEYHEIYDSIKNSLAKNGMVEPRAVEYFLNWWIFQKHSEKGMEVYHIKIKEKDFVEYSRFKEDIMYNGKPEPHWMKREDSKWVSPKSMREAQSEDKKDVKKEIAKGENEKPSFYKYAVLKLWYERGCKKLAEQDVINIFNKTQKGFVNKYIEMLNELNDNNYKANDKRGNAKSFSLVYQQLLKDFENTNKTAFEKVKKHYDQLKEDYPTKNL